MVWTTVGREWRAQKDAARDLGGTINDLWTSQLGYYYESISVGDSDEAPTVTDTDLNATTNKHRRSLLESDSSVIESGGDLILTVVMPRTAANFVWREMGVWIYNGVTRKLVLHDLIESPAEAKTAANTRTAAISIPTAL